MAPAGPAAEASACVRRGLPDRGGLPDRSGLGDVGGTGLRRLRASRAAPAEARLARGLAGVRLQLVQRLGGGLLLGALLARPEPAPQGVAVDDRLDLELPVVRGPAEAEHLVGDRLPAAREKLLQLRLVVDVAALREDDVLLEHLDDRRPHGLVAEGEVDGADERLREVGEHVLVGLQLGGVAALPALAGILAQQLAEAELGGHARAGGAADDVGPQPRQVPLGELREAPVQLGGDAETQHAVAEELEPLVRVHPVRRPRGVREHLAQGRLVQLLGEREESLRQGRCSNDDEGTPPACRRHPLVGPPGGSARLGVHPRHDEVDRVADGLDVGGLFVGDLDTELLFHGHDELDQVEGIGLEVFLETGIHGDLFFVDAQGLDEDPLHVLEHLFTGHAVNLRASLGESTPRRSASQAPGRSWAAGR